MNQYCENGNEVKPRTNSLTGQLRAWVRHAFLSSAACWPVPVPSRFVRCLYCHYVFPDQAEKFRRLIKNLRNIGDVISTDTLVEIIQRGQADGRYFHLSFDDGFKNVATLGASILNETQTPSIFFVPADVIGRTGEDELEFSRSTAHGGRAIQLASWEDLRAAQASGMSIGCHTMSHARLSSLTKVADLEREIVESKRLIERNLDFPCVYFSWPYGRSCDINEQASTIIRDTGYRACFSAIRGSVDESCDSFRIPRHHYELYWPMSHIRYFASGRGEPKCV